jgi:putative SOS response-associated peptidase YedK
MCSRFENKETGLSVFQSLKKNFKGEFILEDLEELKKINIAPTNKILTVIPKTGEFKISSTNWGIKFEEKAPVIFNTRIETIIEKKYWNNVFKSNRCLIPATAFYEWVPVKGKKIPHRISLTNEELFFFPSIIVKKDDLIMSSIITTEPNKFMKDVHRRMPTILKLKDSLKFLEAKPEAALEMCEPLDDNEKMKIEVAEDLIKKESVK